MKPAAEKFLSNYFIPSFISLGVAFPLFAETALLSTADEDIRSAFYSLSNGLHGYENFKTAWRPRLFSNGLAALTTRFSDWILQRTSVPLIENSLELTVALWTVGWFLLTCLFLILFLKRRSVFYVFGMFAALSFGYMPRLSIRIYPWDMPALFVFTVFTLLFLQNKKWGLFVLLPLGTGFKETAIILCAVFLFLEAPVRQKWIGALAAGLLCVAVKVALDLYVKVPVPFFTMEQGLESSRITNVYVIRNIIGLKEIVPLFINSGTLLAFLLLPIYNRNLLAMKFIALLFIAGNLLFGNIFEYRIWFEMIPFALYGLELAASGSDSAAKSLQGSAS